MKQKLIDCLHHYQLALLKLSDGSSHESIIDWLEAMHLEHGLCCYLSNNGFKKEVIEELLEIFGHDSQEYVARTPMQSDDIEDIEEGIQTRILLLNKMIAYYEKDNSAKLGDTLQADV